MVVARLPAFPPLSLLTDVPVFFRAPAVFLLFVLLWGVNTIVLRSRGIHYAQLLALPTDVGAISGKRIVQTVLLLYALLAAFFYLYAESQASHTINPDLIPSLYYIGMSLVLLWPGSQLLGAFRWFVWPTLFSCFVPQPGRVVPFVEVFLADALTSLSKTIADMEAAVCVLFAHVSGDTSTAAKAGCLHSFLQPLVVSIPFLIRMRQCLISARATSDVSKRKMHYVNASKYAASLPVVWLSALQRDDGSGLTLHVLWLLCVTFSSTFSFLWDITQDWGLFQDDRFLRPTLLMGPPLVYFAAMALDLVLRVTWSLKLSGHLHLTSAEFILMFEICEVFRRFIWIFFRIEWEQVKGLAPV